MEGEVGDLGWLDTKVLEGLSGRVDLLINEFPLDLVGMQRRPPQKLVDIVRHRLQQELRHVDVAAMLDNFTVHELSNFGSRVFLRAIQLEGLRRRVVVIQHTLESGSHINHL